MADAPGHNPAEEPDWDSLPPLRDVIAAHDLRAKKALGQNFLLDLNLTCKIAGTAGDHAGLTVFEIGPGPGGLTRGLLRTRADKIIAIEYDPRAVAALQPLVDMAGGRLTVVAGDALHTDLLALAPDARRAIVANLPYNIATPLLVGWLRQVHADPAAYEHMTLMFQREVADRITAAPGGKTYGRLAVLAQWLCTAERRFDVPASAFTPPPKVTSAIVTLRPLARPPGGRPSFAAMETLTAAAFGQRRKMLRAALKSLRPGLLAAAEIDGTRRAEQLSIDEFVRLAVALET